MTSDIENLLKPRYKVIALFPFHDEGMAVNDILNPLSDGSYYVGNNQWYSKELMNKFPNCFKPLAWWEERSPEEMPEYVKNSKGEVVKVKTHFFSHSFEYFVSDDSGDLRYYKYFQPATEADYLEYINKDK